MPMPSTRDRKPSTSKKYLYGLIIDDLIYLYMQTIGPRSPAYKTEIRDLLDTYDPDASFVLKEDGVLVHQRELDNVSDNTYPYLKDLIGLIVIEGLTDEIFELLIGTGDYYLLENLEIEEEDEEEEEDEDE